MARTVKKTPYHPYNKEKKLSRKFTHQQFRRENHKAIKKLVSCVDTDEVDIPVFKKTQGWLTW